MRRAERLDAHGVVVLAGVGRDVRVHRERAGRDRDVAAAGAVDADGLVARAGARGGRDGRALDADRRALGVALDSVGVFARGRDARGPGDDGRARAGGARADVHAVGVGGAGCGEGAAGKRHALCRRGDGAREDGRGGCALDVSGRKLAPAYGDRAGGRVGEEDGVRARGARADGATAHDHVARAAREPDARGVVGGLLEGGVLEGLARRRAERAARDGDVAARHVEGRRVGAARVGLVGRVGLGVRDADASAGDVHVDALGRERVLLVSGIVVHEVGLGGLAANDAGAVGDVNRGRRVRRRDDGVAIHLGRQAKVDRKVIRERRVADEREAQARLVRVRLGGGKCLVGRREDELGLGAALLVGDRGHAAAEDGAQARVGILDVVAVGEELLVGNVRVEVEELGGVLVVAGEDVRVRKAVLLGKRRHHELVRISGNGSLGA